MTAELQSSTDRCRVRPGTLRTVGEVALTVGLVVMLFLAYRTWGTLEQIHDGQEALDRQLEREWRSTEARATPAPDVTPGVDSTPAEPSGAHAPESTVDPHRGSPLSRLHLPRLGLHWVVVEGTNRANLRNAPGHYKGSAMPGELGNFAVAGHRTPGIFWDLDMVRQGDAVIVELASSWLVYRVYQTRIVPPNARKVLAAVPDHPEQQPTKALLTLTTCNPKWQNYQRLIVHAELDYTMPKDRGRPLELAA